MCIHLLAYMTLDFTNLFCSENKSSVSFLQMTSHNININRFDIIQHIKITCSILSQTLILIDSILSKTLRLNCSRPSQTLINIKRFDIIQDIKIIRFDIIQDIIIHLFHIIPDINIDGFDIKPDISGDIRMGFYQF